MMDLFVSTCVDPQEHKSKSYCDQVMDFWTFFMNINVFFPGPLKMFVKVFYLLFGVVF